MTKLKSNRSQKVHRPKTALTFICTFLLATLASCGGTVSQCKQFADVTQQYQTLREGFETDLASSQIKISGAQNLSDVQAAAADYTAAINRVTEQIDTMLQDISELNITDEQLAEYQESYVITLTGYKTATASAGNAMQLVRDAKTEEALRNVFSTYQTKQNRAYDDILSLDTKEAGVLEQVNAYCAQPPE